VVEDDAPVTGLRAPERPKDLVGSLAKETLGRGRVERGLVHPYYSALGKALVKNWDADRVAKSGLKGLAEQTAENFKLMNEIWSDRAAAYAKSGSPIDAEALGTNRRAPVNNNILGLSGVDLDARKEMQRQLREQFKATRRATIRVVQDRTGRLVKVELVEPSHDQNVDKEALKDVRAAAEKLPPPPEEALEGKQQLSSLWSFELTVSITPPIPTFTFEFDEALGFIDARLPLDRRIYKKVRLVSVE
jgi:TonB family protein